MEELLNNHWVTKLSDEVETKDLFFQSFQAVGEPQHLTIENDPIPTACATHLTYRDGYSEMNKEETAELSTTPVASPKQNTFKSFRSRNQHSVNLLRAMISKPPFKQLENGADNPEKWMEVVNILKQQGELLGGTSKRYENVTVRSCILAWKRYKAEHMNRISAQVPSTITVEEDPWHKLIQSVFKLEQSERPNQVSPEPPELQRDNIQQEITSTPAVSSKKRQRELSTSTDSIDSSETDLERLPPRPRPSIISSSRSRSHHYHGSRSRSQYNFDQELLRDVRDFIREMKQMHERYLVEQKGNDELLIRAIENTNRVLLRANDFNRIALERQVTSIAMALGSNTERQSSELANTISNAMMTSAQIQAEAVKAPEERQTLAFSVLNSALSNRR